MKSNSCRNTRVLAPSQGRICRWKPQPGDEQLLARCETEIEAGLDGRFRAGHALLIVKRRQLFLKTHDTWNEYCRERWNISRFYAHRLMAAAEVAAKLLVNGNIPAPETEAQVRPLVRLNPKVRSRVWEQAVRQAGNRPVTLELVKTAADELSGAEPGPRHGARHSHHITSDKDELLKWLDKAKLFVEQGYGEAARNVLKDILSSMERHPEVILGQGNSGIHGEDNDRS